jgi:hypothetical protein
MGITKSVALIICITLLCLVGGVLAWDHFYGQGSKYLGKWVSDQYNSTVTITRVRAGYYFQDQSGKYPASLKNGQLVINFGGFTATAYVDEQTDRLNVLFFGMSQTYKRSSK